MKKKNLWKTALAGFMAFLLLSVGTIIVCAFYMSRVYLYTDAEGGRQLFRVGMELNTFFDQLNSGTTAATTAIPAVANFTPLGIPCTDISIILQTDGADDYSTTNTTDTNVAYLTNKTSQLCVKRTKTGGTEKDPVYTYEYVYNSDPNCDWGSASNPYIISRSNHLQNLYVLQNAGYFKQYFQKTENDGTITSLGTREDNMPYFLVCTSLGTPVTIDGTGKVFSYIGSSSNPFIGYLGGAFVTANASGTELTTTVNGQTSTQSAIYNALIETEDASSDIGLFGCIGYLGEAPVSTGSAGDEFTFEGSVSSVRDLLLYDVRIKVEDKSVWTAIIDATAHLFGFSNLQSSMVDTVPHETHHVGILAGHVEYATVEYISVYYSNDDIAAIDVDLKTASTNSTSANFYSVSGILGYVVGMNSEQVNGTITVSGKGNDDIAVAGGDGTGGGKISGIGRGYVTAKEIFDAYSDSGKIVRMITKDASGNDVTHFGLLVQFVSTPITYVKENGNIGHVYGTEGTTYLKLADGTAVHLDDSLNFVTTYAVSYNWWGIAEVTTQDWYSFIIHDTTATDPSKEYLYYENGKVVYGSQANVERVGVSLQLASDSNTNTDPASFERLCTQYVRDRIGSQYTGLIQTTNRYYFYDGVFTFALSDASDTILPTWLDGTVDSITVGENKDDAWTQESSGLPNSVLAFIKPITTVQELRSGKEIFIAYKDDDGNYHFVTLDGNSTYTQGDRENATTTNQYQLSEVSEDLYKTITAAVNSGTIQLDPTSYTTAAELKTNWGSIKVLDLGYTAAKTLTLEQLRNQYQVKVKATEQNAINSTYEDDATTQATDDLKTNAKNGTSSTYYRTSDVSQIHTTTLNGEDFTFFTRIGQTDTSSPSSIQNLIKNINGLYYPLSNVTKKTATNDTYYFKVTNNNTTVDYTTLFNAINAWNNKVYNESDLTVQTVDGVSYYVLNSATPLSISDIQKEIDKFNDTYYDYNSVTQKTSVSPARFTINSGATAVNVKDIYDAVNTYNNTYYYDDGRVIDSTTQAAIKANGEGNNYTQSRTRTFTEFYYFDTWKHSDNWINYCYFRLFKVSNGTVSSQLSYKRIWWGNLNSSEALSTILSLFSNTYKEDGLTMGTYGGVTLPVLYELSGTYYSSWKRDTNSGDFIVGSTNANVSNYRFSVSRSETYNIIYKTYTGNGIVYSWNGDNTTFTDTPTAQMNGTTRATVANTSKWDEKTVFGQNFNLWTCSKGSNAIMVVRYVYDGIFVDTLTGNGITYKTIKSVDASGNKTYGTAPTAPFTEVSGSTLTVGGKTYKLYRSANNLLGVRVANVVIDTYFAKNSMGKGFTYNLVNSSGALGSGINAESKWTDTEIDFTYGGKTYNIYMTDGHLGIKVAKIRADGVFLQTSGAGGITMTLNASDKSVKYTFTSLDVTNTLNTLSDGTPIVYAEKHFGVALAKFKLDGLVLQTMTGSGVQYTLYTESSSSALTDINANNFKITGTDTKNVYSGANISLDFWLGYDKMVVRTANFKIDGFFTAEIEQGVATAETYYKYNDGDRTHQTPARVQKEDGSAILTYPFSNGTATKDYTLYVADGKLCIELIHYISKSPYTYTFWHTVSNSDPSFENAYKLRILRRAYTFSSEYSIVCATDAYASNTSNFQSKWLGITYSCNSVSNSVECSVILNGDGTAYLQYTVGGQTRYLSYSTTGGYFTSGTSQGSTTKLYLFTAEGTHDQSVGEKVLPVAGTEHTTVKADTYVLVADKGYLSGDTTTSGYNPGNETGYMQDTTYTLKSLSDLYDEGRGFKNDTGGSLTIEDLQNVFSLGKGISQVNMINLWGGNTGTIFQQDGYVKAPVGTTGEESYIPLGCVAFRVNKTLASNKIRVIVAVPVSEYFYGKTVNDTLLNPTQYLDFSKDYSFCMWKVDEANEADSFTFSVDNCMAAFELPRSCVYDPSTAGDNYYRALEAGSDYDVTADNAVKKYVSVYFGGKLCRAYLNGEQVLVAYEFDATEEGIYLLGSTKECRIVYFSADSTANEGKDGSTNYKLGTIDFVYDNGNHTVNTETGVVTGNAGARVITVRDYNKGSVAVNDYETYYYPTLDLIYTDNAMSPSAGDSDKSNGFPNINNFVIYIRRVATLPTDGTDFATFIYQVKSYKQTNGGVDYDMAYIKSVKYSDLSDEIVRRENGSLERATEASSTTP